MHTANQYINSVDDGAEYIASKGVEETLGEGWTSWGVGKVSKATAGMLTGLGKGITLLGNRDAQASDYVIGTIEVAGAAIGGSKLLIKGTQLPGFLKGLGEGAWITTKGSVNSLSTLVISKGKYEVDSLIKAAVKDGMETAGFEARQAVNQAMLAAIAESNRALKAELGNLIQAGLKAGWNNFNATLEESLNDFARKQFTSNLSAIATALGGSATGFVDNVMASMGEDIIKEMVDKAMAEAPIAAELKGLWTGSVVYTSIQVPEADSEKAAKEGCDIGAQFKKLEGKPLPISIHFDGSPSGSGNAIFSYTQNPSMKMSKGSSVNLRYTYSAGAMTISQGINAGTISIRGEARRLTQGYSMGGPIRVAGGGNGIHISMSGTFNVTKPH